MFISANDSQVAELAVTYFQILHFVSRKCREFSSSDAMFKVSCASDYAYNFYNNLKL